MVLSFSPQSAKIFKKICLLQGGLTSSIFLDLSYCVKLRLSRASIRCEAIAVHSLSMHFFPSAVALCFSLGFPKYG